MSALQKMVEDAAQSFRSELQQLLNKYGAELSAKDHYEGYAECGEDIRMTVDFYLYAEGEYVGLVEINLGSYMQAEKGAPNAQAAQLAESKERE